MRKLLFKRNYNIREMKAMTKKPLLPGILVLIVIVTGTLGYYLLWYDKYDATIIDALFMTLTTITTIGFGEVKPLDDTARLFTMAIALIGIGALFFILSVWMENLFILQLNNYSGRKKVMKSIDKLSGHIILVGYGRVGQLAAHELLTNKEEFVVIDDDFVEEDSLGKVHTMLTITGDATADEVLIKAGIERARGMIISTPDPATNVFIVLSAKVLNPDIFIVARSDNENDNEKLRRAGANRIVNPYAIGGVRMANLMLNTNIIDFMETSFGEGEENLKIENLTLSEDSHWIDMALKDIKLRQKTGATVLAVIRSGKPLVNPGGDFVIHSGDELVIFGTKKQLKNLEDIRG